MSGESRGQTDCEAEAASVHGVICSGLSSGWTSAGNKAVAVRKKPVIHFAHYTGSEHCFVENIKSDIVCLCAGVYFCS